MENRITANDRILLRRFFKLQTLICDWLRDYPYKRYPKEKFQKRFELMQKIEAGIKIKLEERGFIL